MPNINTTNITNDSLLESLLGHPAISENRAALASLMCSSRQLQRAVHQHCIGQVHAGCKVRTTAQLLDFYRWPARSGHLAKSVGFDGGYTRPGEPDVWRSIVRDPTWEAALAGALQRAALAAPHGLQLQSFRGWASSSVLLRVLPTSHLTHLSLSNLNAVPDSSVADIIAGLAGLTGLQALLLDSGNSSNSSSSVSPTPGTVEAYLPALPALTNLTSLVLFGSFDWQLLRIPELPQLQYLRLRMPDSSMSTQRLRRQQPLLLGHLSGVSELDLESIAVQQQDQLPPQLQKLSSHDMFSAEPLCSLSQLTKLCIERVSTPAPQLQRLGEDVRSLRSVELCYKRGAHVANSAAGWPALPLTALSVDLRESAWQVTDRVTLQQIARSTGLTYLDIMGCDLANSDRWELAAAVAKLTGLQELSLLELQFYEAEEDEQAALAEQQAAAAAAAAAEAEAPMQQPAAGPGAAAAALGQPAAAAAAGALGQPAAVAAAAAGALGQPVAAAAGALGQPAAAGAGAAQPANEGVPDVVGWPAILRAAAGLPQLRDFACDAPLNAATIAQLAAATQLQLLNVTNSLSSQENWQQDSPCEAVLMHLLCSLPALRVLCLDDQPHLSDAAMPVIARLMTQLTTLSLNNCSRVTDAGLPYLTGLRQLQSLRLLDTPVTRSAARMLLPNVDVWLG
jgi:hypothetical protein